MHTHASRVQQSCNLARKTAKFKILPVTRSHSSLSSEASALKPSRAHAQAPKPCSPHGPFCRISQNDASHMRACARHMSRGQAQQHICGQRVEGQAQGRWPSSWEGLSKQPAN